MPIIDLGGGNIVDQPLSVVAPSAAYGGSGQHWGQQLMQQGQQLAGTMNPFDAMRPQMMQQLQNLMSNPSSIANTPGFQAGLEGVQRSMAAQGYQGSGNMMNALQNYSGDFYMKQMQQLSGLAGAGALPGAGAPLALSGMEKGINLIGQGQATDQYQQMMQGIMSGGAGPSIADLAAQDQSNSYNLSSGPSIYDQWVASGSPQPSGWGGAGLSEGYGFGGIGAY
jgi:hypothetical protein